MREDVKDMMFVTMVGSGDSNGKSLISISNNAWTIYLVYFYCDF